MLKRRTGLKLSPPGAHARFFAATAPGALPAIPAAFGYTPDIQAKIAPNAWGMLANDSYGDCTIAGPMHAIMYRSALAGTRAIFTALDALDDYKAVIGIPFIDEGCDMTTVAAYWQSTGMRDYQDNRYKIAAWASIQGSDAEKPDLQHVYACAYLFGAAGIGIMVPDSADDQFEAGETWDVSAPTSGEYHFVPVIAKGPQGLGIVTWGQFTWLSERFFAFQCKEALAYLPTANDPNAALFAAAT